MRIFETDLKLLAQFYNEIESILIYESDESIAEIYCEVNSWKIPDKLKSVTAYKGLADTHEQSSDYFVIFSDIVDQLISQQTIRKVRFRNLHKREWAYGKTFIYFHEMNPERHKKKKSFWRKLISFFNGS